MPTLTGVLETSLYVADLDRSSRFYRDLFGLETLFTDQRLCALNVAGKQVLLLFKQGASSEPMPLGGGVLPGHDGAGRLHLAFAIPAAERAAWEQRLVECGVALESTITWPAGGVSLYFRDPDGHLLELATPGIWTIY
jgi:catechol 2,3-dioxygenase-like lactoylglutathione lyase family enzyme